MEGCWEGCGRQVVKRCCVVELMLEMPQPAVLQSEFGEGEGPSAHVDAGARVAGFATAIPPLAPAIW